MLCAPAAQRTHLLELDVEVFGERILMTWTYSAQLHPRQTVVDLNGLMTDALHDLAGRAQRTASPRSPSTSVGFDVLPTELQQALAELSEGWGHHDDT